MEQARLEPLDPVLRDVLEPLDMAARIFASRSIRPVVAAAYDPAVPVWLEPPSGAWRYVSGLRPAGRLSWAVALILAWMAYRVVRRR